ncbi:MAG: NBR1-Ig-like domain-containing protein [Anaerolineales bacterium]|nr:NBR1-Ig-like domain-containing protein [Anaerolineales bacterium]
MNFWRRKNFGWLLMALLLASCFPSPTVTPLPTATITAVSPTPFPTEAVLPATPTPTSSPTITPTITATRPLETGGLAIVFIGETVPDGTNLQPGQAFQKTWTLKNGGTRPWVEGFTLAMVSSSPAGENLGSLDDIPLAQEVQPGETIQISVDLVTPEQDGRYTVYYQLRDEAGTPVPDSRIWVTVTVGAVSSTSSVTTGSISAQFLGASLQGGEYNVTFCMQLPDSRAWFPWDVTLVVDQQPISPSGGRSDPATALTDHKCFTFSYPANGMEPGGSVQLSIGKVTLDPAVHQDENCASAKQVLMKEYPGLDFICGGPGFWYTHLVTPPGMTVEQADQLIMDAMSSAIYGPWVLTIR